jgi:hypothetical protein
MKTVSVMILRRWGFRTVLSVNGAIASLMVAGFGLFSATTPYVLIAAVLLLSGCLRSLQFTALNAIAFADIVPKDMSQAASISSMVQRLSQSMGIAVAAYILQISSELHGHPSIDPGDFLTAFIAIALISLVSAPLHRRLAKDAGVVVSGHARA